MRARIALVTLALFLAASVVTAQSADPPPPSPDEPAETTEEKPPLPSNILEQVVVSASATAEAALDSPAAVDVLTGEDLAIRPGDHLVDQLRRVPGINVVQFSARDVNIASRQATGGINNSTLALIDGRNIYEDFLGFVLWEFAPADAATIERIEVVRGPASALWGANAVGGLVHVITRRPQDTLGGSLELGAGSHGALRVRASESFLAGPWAVRLSAGFFEVDPFDRPATIANVFGETIDPDFGLIQDGGNDSGTSQPRFDLRADVGDPLETGRLIVQAGAGRTRGWIATGLGPFEIEPGTQASYLQGRYQHGNLEGQVYVNLFDGAATNLINAIDFDFTSALLHGSLRGRRPIGTRGALGFGVEIERSAYDLSIAPGGTRRLRGGVFGEADVTLLPKLSIVAGARVDTVKETIGAVLSPRLALRYKPTPRQTVRLAWGRAFRAPSVVETDLDVPAIPVALLDWEVIDAEVVGFPFFAPLAQVVCAKSPGNCGVDEGEVPSYLAVTSALGNRDLEEETTSSIELGYAAQLGRFAISGTVYRTKSHHDIDFPLRKLYGIGSDREPGTGDDVILPTDPDGDGIDEAPPIDVCPYVNALPPFRDLCPVGPVPYNQFLSIMLDGRIPALFQYQNAQSTENRGLELGTHWSGPRGLSAWVNWSWQDVPRTDGVSMTDRVSTLIHENAWGQDLDGDGVVADTSQFVNIPARDRLGVGAQVDRGRWYAGLTWDHVDRTFWQDVLTSTFWGFVPSYDLVGIRGGWRFHAPGIELSAQVTNLLDEEIQQHIFGDIIDRRASVALTVRFGPPRDSLPKERP